MLTTLASCKKEGCTDSDAENYDLEAKKDDGSCVFANNMNGGTNSGGSGTTNNEPVISSTYYIKAQFDQDWKIAQTNGENLYNATGEIGWKHIPDVFNTDETVSLYLVKENGVLDSTRIMALNGKTIPFDNGQSLYATFNWDENGDNYSSTNINQGTLTITEVEYKGRYFGLYPYFNLKGTFSCGVEQSSTSSTINITNGEFNILVSEEDV